MREAHPKGKRKARSQSLPLAVRRTARVDKVWQTRQQLAVE